MLALLCVANSWWQHSVLALLCVANSTPDIYIVQPTPDRKSPTLNGINRCGVVGILSSLRTILQTVFSPSLTFFLHLNLCGHISYSSKGTL